MATKKTAAKVSAEKPAFPRNLGVTGILSFPLWTESQLGQLKEWRADKGFAKPKFPDVKGGTLFVTQPMVDKIQAYILNELLPYAEALHVYDDGKGLDPETAATIRERVENEDWTESNDEIVIPLRKLTEKDQENLPNEDIVAKFVYRASGGNDISPKALARDEDGTLVVVDLDDLTNVNQETDQLFWGARNTFRGAFNLNPYMAAKSGISAYTRALYLRSDLPMSWGGGDDTETILEDDFED